MEVLAVIIIAALLSAAVAAGFSQVPRMKLRESARKMAGVVRFVSGRARTSRTMLRLVMDLGSRGILDCGAAVSAGPAPTGAGSAH